MGKKPDIQIVTVKEPMITEDWKNREFLMNITDKVDKMVKILAKFGKYDFIDWFSMMLESEREINKAKLFVSNKKNTTKTELNCKTKLKMFEERVIHAEKTIEYLESLFEDSSSDAAATGDGRKNNGENDNSGNMLAPSANLATSDLVRFFSDLFHFSILLTIYFQDT